MRHAISSLVLHTGELKMKLQTSAPNSDFSQSDISVSYPKFDISLSQTKIVYISKFASFND